MCVKQGKGLAFKEAISSNSNFKNQLRDYKYKGGCERGQFDHPLVQASQFLPRLPH